MRLAVFALLLCGWSAASYAEDFLAPGFMIVDAEQTGVPYYGTPPVTDSDNSGYRVQSDALIGTGGKVAEDGFPGELVALTTDYVEMQMTDGMFVGNDESGGYAFQFSAFEEDFGDFDISVALDSVITSQERFADVAKSGNTFLILQENGDIIHSSGDLFASVPRKRVVSLSGPYRAGIEFYNQGPAYFLALTHNADGGSSVVRYLENGTSGLVYEGSTRYTALSIITGSVWLSDGEDTFGLIGPITDPLPAVGPPPVPEPSTLFLFATAIVAAVGHRLFTLRTKYLLCSGTLALFIGAGVSTASADEFLAPDFTIQPFEVLFPPEVAPNGRMASPIWDSEFSRHFVEGDGLFDSRFRDENDQLIPVKEFPGELVGVTAWEGSQRLVVDGFVVGNDESGGFVSSFTGYEQPDGIFGNYDSDLLASGLPQLSDVAMAATPQDFLPFVLTKGGDIQSMNNGQFTHFASPRRDNVVSISAHPLTGSGILTPPGQPVILALTHNRDGGSSIIRYLGDGTEGLVYEGERRFEILSGTENRNIFLLFDGTETMTIDGPWLDPLPVVGPPPVPEPSSLVLIAAALLANVVYAKRRGGRTARRHFPRHERSAI